MEGNVEVCGFLNLEECEEWVAPLALTLNTLSPQGALPLQVLPAWGRSQRWEAQGGMRQEPLGEPGQEEGDRKDGGKGGAYSGPTEETEEAVGRRWWGPGDRGQKGRSSRNQSLSLG